MSSRRRGDAGRRLAVFLAATVLAVAGVTGIARALAPAGSSAFDGPLPPCRVGDVLTSHREPADWARTLLDPEHGLEPDDVPPNLVRLADVGLDGVGSIRAFVVDDLRAMAADARRDGSPFRITSAYRSYEQQQRTLASLEAAWGRDEAQRSAARPGHSEHQLGTTIDVDGDEAWLAANAHRYGFVLSYPEEHRATICYKPEAWHFRYLGRELAADVRASGLSLRAWLWERQ